MDFRFNAEEWKALSSQERAYRCRVLAQEARALADDASLSMQAAYLELAAQWDHLAENLAKES